MDSLSRVSRCPPPRVLSDASRDSRIFICVRLFHDEILEQLAKYKITDERIVNVGKMSEKILSNYTYFDLAEMKGVKDEVFIDCGAFDGETSLIFAKKYPDFRHSYLFEPDSENRKLCEKNILQAGLNDKMTIIPKGLWSKTDNLPCYSHRSSSSFVRSSVGSGSTVPVTSLDETLGDEKVTFIKMDIEGAELEALRGAKNIIRREKPRLAISVYHKPEDIVELPDLILSCNPDYKFYIRHYSYTSYDTVLYAIPV